MKFNGQDIRSFDLSNSQINEGIDSFSISEDLVNKVLSEKGESASRDARYTIDTKRGNLIKINGNNESYVASAQKTWHGFSELGNFAEARETYKKSAELGKTIFAGLSVITIFLIILTVLILIWLEVTYGA